jgi:uncharacterized protein (TIGR02996 family)
MHPELTGLLHTARFALADDTPRLVVADWLEEHGSESDRLHAEYIRVCLTLHRMPPWQPERRPLVQRRTDLENQFMLDWAGSLRSFPGVNTLQHERGMICLHLEAAVLDRLDELFALPDAAWVEGVRCWGWPADAYQRLLTSPACGRLASLGLGDCPEQAVRTHLSASPHVKQLGHLLLINARLTSAGWADVVGSGRLSPLTVLCLLGNRIGRASLTAMQKAGLVAHAVSLDVSQNQMSGQGIRSLTRLDCDALRSLDIGWNKMGDRGLEALAAAPLGRNLERLELSSNEIGSEGVEALAASEHLGRLACLDLSFNHVSDGGVIALARSPLAQGLRSLALRYNQVGDGGAQAILDSPLRKGLLHLDLTYQSGLTDGMRRKMKRAFGKRFV